MQLEEFVINLNISKYQIILKKIHQDADPVPLLLFLYYSPAYSTAGIVCRTATHLYKKGCKVESRCTICCRRSMDN